MNTKEEQMQAYKDWYNSLPMPYKEDFMNRPALGEWSAKGFNAGYPAGYQAALNSQAKSVPEDVMAGMHYEYPHVDDSEEGDAGKVPVLVPDGFFLMKADNNGSVLNPLEECQFALAHANQYISDLEDAAPQPPQVEDRVRGALQMFLDAINYDGEGYIAGTDAWRLDRAVKFGKTAIAAMKEPNTLEGGE